MLCSAATSLKAVIKIIITRACDDKMKAEKYIAGLVACHIDLEAKTEITPKIIL